MKLNSDEVRYCPKCGAPPEMEEWDSDTFAYIVRCSNYMEKRENLCIGLVAFGNTTVEAINTWNKKVREFLNGK